MSRLLIIGNSVSKSGQGQRVYSQWLEAELAHTWELKVLIGNGKTIDEMESEIRSSLDEFKPDAAVLQVGINECAPRPLSRRERAMLGRTPRWMRDRVVQLIHVYRPQIIRWRRLHQTTPLSEFSRCLSRVVENCAHCGVRLMVLPITHVPAAVEIRTPFTNQEIDRYNEVLKRLAGDGHARYATESELFGSRSPMELCDAPESVHLNSAAHELIARFIIGWLSIAVTPSSSPTRLAAG